MMITENNCEEYFLLYTDDELNNSERNAVETFVVQHPQYKTILDSFLQTKLIDNEPVLFSNKKSLYKNADSEIGIDNYDDYFLLYTDNELSETDKENTERFVLQHPQLQPEFTLLQQTKLPAETILFPNKKTLYKQEKKRRVLSLFITGISMAAAVMGIVALRWQSSPQTNNTGVKNIAATQSSLPVKPSVKPKIIIAPQQQDTSNSQQAIAQQTQPEKVIDKLPVLPKKVAVEKDAKQDNTIIASAHDNITATMPDPTARALQTQPAAKTDNQPTNAATLKPLEEVNTAETNVQNVLALSSDNNIDQPAVYKELNTDDDAQTLYVSAFQLNKAKVNGFIKSASRLLGNHTKQNTE